MKTLLTLFWVCMTVTLFAQNIVFDGDSNTHGEFIEPAGYWTGSTAHYPNQTMGMVSGYSQNNIGVNSATSVQIVSNMSSRYPGIVNSNTVFALIIGINDFGLGGTATEVFTNVKAITTYVKSLGCTKIVVATYPPSDRVAVGSSPDLQRLAYNQMLRDSAQFYNLKLADVAATPQMSTYSTVYYADNIHWGIAGCTVVATKMSEQINSFSSAPTTPANGTWLGSVSSDINNASNWQGGVPTSSTNVIINSGTQYAPDLNSTLTTANLTVGSGVTLNASGTLKVAGEISGNGTISATSGTIELNGTSAQTLPAAMFAGNTINNLTINNAAGVSLSGSLELRGVYTPVAGTFNTNNNLTLKSTANGTARIAQGASSGGYIIGNVTVERFIGTPSAKRAWRLLTAPLTSTSGSPVSIFDSWQLSGATGSSAAGRGTLITGPGGDPNNNGLDASSGYSLKEYDGQNLVGVNNTKTAQLFGTASSAANKGYFLYVRGDRSNTNLGSVSSTTLQATGALQTGDQTFPINNNAAGLTLIGNPYASPIDFDAFRQDNSAANIKPNFSYWDPTLGAVGGFVSVTYDGNNSGYTITPSGANRTRFVQSGQAMFIETTHNGGVSTVTFKEAHKATTTINNLFRIGNQLEKLAIDMNLKNPDGSVTLLDGVVGKFNNSYSEQLGDEDAKKIMNVEENIGIIRNGNILSAEGRPLVDQNDTMFLNMVNMKVGNSYEFTFQPSNFNAPLVNAFLEDSYLNTATPISLSNPTTVNFSITTDANSSADNRFRVIFRTASTLPVNFTGVKAVAGTNSVSVQWNVATEDNISAYEVERSSNGTSFAKVGTVAATNNNGVANSYKWIDNTPVAGTNYYRIKVVEKSAASFYSSVVSAKISNTKSGVSVYPNPVKGNTLNVQLNMQQAGRFTINIYSTTGQLVQAKAVDHVGGFLNVQVTLSANAAKGIYQVQVVGDNTKITLPVIFE
jgi:hypothetical protein